MWKLERRKRITASTFGKICKMTAKTVTALLYSTFMGTHATEFGLIHEVNAIALFEQQYGKRVQKSGLIIDKDIPFLACSPDGLVEDDGVVEVKSSEKSGDLSPIEAFQCGKIDFFHKPGDTWCLKKNP
uniref:YqaJ viral recombinase domain-containing protein n=1 Tax=Photinus pyralis TaxID=7054 RepID=A0A1Y1NL98_PHOPY